MRHFTTLLFVLLFAAVGRAAENEIHLQNGTILVTAPSDWVILAHNPVGQRTAVVWQIYGNEAEEGTPTSTNLTVSTFDLNDLDAARAFAAPQARKAEQNGTTRQYEGWSIREWQGEQDGSQYGIMDARAINHRLNVGILVRLAWPILEKNPTDYEDKMKAVFKSMLDSMGRNNAEKPQ